MQKRILIADDCPVNQVALSALIKSLDYECEMVSNGADALIEAHSGNYSLIIMDLRLPEMDGFDTAKAIRSKGIDIPIIGHSAYPLSTDIDKCTKVGMNGFIGKPVDKTALACLLKQLITPSNNQQINESKSKLETTELMSLGIRAYKLGDYATAINCLAKATAFAPDLWDCRMYLAMAYWKISQFPEAAKELHDIIAGCPESGLKKKAVSILHLAEKGRSEEDTTK